MLSPGLELSDLDARHVRNWWHVLVPPRVWAGAPWALVVLDAGRVIHVILQPSHEVRPPESLREPVTQRGALAAWARTLGVGAVVALERDLFAGLIAELDRSLRPTDDPVAQGLVALRALKQRAGHGAWTEPAVLDLLPPLAEGPVQRTFDLLIPDGSALVAYIIEDDRSRVHASIIAEKRGGSIVRASTHAAIADLVPEVGFARVWDREHRRVAAAVEERFARPSVALFAERATVQRIMTGPSDQLAREINARRVIVDPAPAWLLGLLGGAAVAAIAGRAASALAGMLPQGVRSRGSALASRARDAIKDSGAHPFALLGFDPLELWSQVKHFYRA